MWLELSKPALPAHEVDKNNTEAFNVQSNFNHENIFMFLTVYLLFIQVYKEELIIERILKASFKTKVINFLKTF